MQNWRERISQPQYGMVVEKDIYVETRDGARLALDVYRPDAEGEFPALLALGPFGKDSDLRRFGLKLCERGGKAARRRAVVAVARRLAVLLHRLWVSGVPYDALRNSERGLVTA